MKHNLYTIYDVKAETYLFPLKLQNHAVALRELKRAVNDPQTQFFNHPEDFTLFFLGTFDDNTTWFELEDTKVPLATLLELKEDNNG